MKKIAAFLCSLGMLAISAAAASDLPVTGYRFALDLTNVKNDRLLVSLQTPVITQNEIIYNMPKIVPGTYSIYDFGKFVSEFTAYDQKGQALPVEQLDKNRWKIRNATSLSRITYLVDDTWDTKKREDQVFEPAGTNIEAGKNFIINTHGFMGYFDGMKRMPFEVTITKPQNFYGSTPLQASSSTPTTDTYRLESYMELADSPLMYNVPDTAMLKVGGADVLISVYSPSGNVHSKPIAANIKEILNAQKNFLGGKLPVNKYAFLIYVADKPNLTGAYGALEHSYSSVYYLPEMPEDILAPEVRNIAAHEFFHILTPLAIHSEEIHDFDYINPKMSKHLWLYEGVTEYFATHAQVNQKLITPETYLERLQEYIRNSKAYYNDTLPFTELSKFTLDKHQKQYGNVYQKGALIGLALDIRLRQLSGGKYGLINLMQDLSAKYGKDRPFKDDELFDEIAAMTYPEIRDFFRRYVEGPEPLPLQELFKAVGMNYEARSISRVNTLGQVGMAYDDETGKLVITNIDNMNDFGRKMGYQKGDQLLSINNVSITLENLTEVLEQQVKNAKEGAPIVVEVGRKDRKGNVQPRKLKGRITAVETISAHALTTAPSATPQQQKLRDAWLYGTM